MVQQKVPIGEDISQQRVECGEAHGLGHHQEQKTVVPPSSTVRVAGSSECCFPMQASEKSWLNCTDLDLSWGSYTAAAKMYSCCTRLIDKLVFLMCTQEVQKMSEAGFISSRRRVTSMYSRLSSNYCTIFGRDYLRNEQE